MASLKYKNFAKSTLASQLLIAGVTADLAVGDGAKCPASGDFIGVIWGAGIASPDGDANAEIVLGTARTADAVTITRAQEGTSAKQWEISDNIAFCVITAGNMEALAHLTGFAMSGAINEAKGIDIASDTTCDIGAATGNYINVTGTTTITGLGTVQAGTRRIVTFTGALVLTHNATSLKLKNNGANIMTEAGDVATFVSLGSGNWECVCYERNNASQILHVREDQASSVLSQSSVAAAWIIRTLNTIKTNSIAGASLGSNQITLPAGTYFIDAVCPANRTTNHKAGFYNVTDAAFTILGTSEYADGTNINNTHSFVRGRFTITSAKVFEIRHYTAITGGYLGQPGSISGIIEVYTDVLITKVY